MLVLGVPLAHLQATTPIPAAILGLNAVSHLLLLAGRGGLAVAAIGLLLLRVAAVVAMRDLGAAEPFYAGATLPIAIGMIAAGAAVFGAGRGTGWRRWAPLVCGLIVPLVLVPALTPGLAPPAFAAHDAIGQRGACWPAVAVALREEATTPG